MAMFDFMKNPSSAGAPPGTSPNAPGTPVDYVRDMRAQGYPDDQIVAALRQQNYPEQMINDALNQAQVKAAVPVAPAAVQDFNPPKDEGFEEIAEAIVKEKWDDVKAELAKNKEFNDNVTQEISQIKQELKDLKDDLNNLHKAIVSKISDYDQNLLSVGTEIKAMEKVFQNILPELTKSVSDLSKISKDMKKK